MLKFVTVCGAGVGSSMMLRLYTQQILDSEQIDGTVEASDISSVSPNDYDVIITTSDFAERLRTNNNHIIRIENMMDKEFLKSEILRVKNELGE
ncbi:PTS sugar transporter subunit IIB [Helcococcus kunzii]|uniref:PTS sugar transporter subunit IIB n=1 Tax=Helcococcus kunzii TaxID=40091 RepID=UPI001C95114F|nr:PTS sugar transporter subunit IIB [Helcococcus kunzii]QZO76803.1 PTS sugar transporter subunit IIB [Helcococcus kunzii]